MKLRFVVVLCHAESIHDGPRTAASDVGQGGYSEPRPAKRLRSGALVIMCLGLRHGEVVARVAREIELSQPVPSSHPVAASSTPSVVFLSFPRTIVPVENAENTSLEPSDAQGEVYRGRRARLKFLDEPSISCSRDAG